MTNENASQSEAEHALIEIGWIVAGTLDGPDEQAVQTARDDLQQQLSREFPQFRWEMPLLMRGEAVKQTQLDPTQLLDQCTHEAGSRNWDFTVVVTAADLTGVYVNQPSAAISRTLEAMVISTAQIDPRARDARVEPEQRTTVMAESIRRILLYALGYWAGLTEATDDSNAMYPPLRQGSETGARKSNLEAFSDTQKDRVSAHLAEIADRRLEEQVDAHTQGTMRFYAKAGWRNRAEIARIVWQARAWEFPFRLSRFTTAAVSTCLVMLMTAEVWDLGMSQSAGAVLLLSTFILVATTAFIVLRQNLLVERGNHGLREQSVLTNVATVTIVGIGVSFTYCLFYLLALAASLTLFPNDLATTWIAAEELTSPTLSMYTRLAGFIAAIGIAIGALGASFEEQNFVRHVTLIDTEL